MVEKNGSMNTFFWLSRFWRMSPVERIEQAPDLIAVPHVAPLELGQRHVPVVDVIEDSGNLHVERGSPLAY